jgi:hypothetical protein
MRAAIPAGFAAAALLLAACSGGGEQPGDVTADEARQLDDAAAMLDANSVDLNAVTTDDGSAAAANSIERNAS